MSRADILAYMRAHPRCEGCGRWVSPNHQPHHIRSRGAGGSDEHANLLRLCMKCENRYSHGLEGMIAFMRRFPWLRDKILAAKPKLISMENDPVPSVGEGGTLADRHGHIHSDPKPDRRVE